MINEMTSKTKDAAIKKKHALYNAKNFECKGPPNRTILKNKIRLNKLRMQEITILMKPILLVIIFIPITAFF